MSAFSTLGLTGNAPSSATSASANDPHAVPNDNDKARHYYVWLHSRPRLIFSTRGNQSPAQRRRNWKLDTVFRHPLVDLWNGGLWEEVQDAMDAHGVREHDRSSIVSSNDM